MNLYKFHTRPKSLDHYDLAHEHIVHLFWEKYRNNPIELKKREAAIAKSAYYSYEYAVRILTGPFPAGEAAIAKDASYSYLYAKSVLKSPFKLGEPAIARNANCAVDYAMYVLKGPFKLGEPVIMANQDQADMYTYFLDTQS